MRILSYLLLIIGFLVTGVVATGTAMTFQWPGFVLLGAAGLVSVTSLFQGKILGVSPICLTAGLGVTLLVVVRAITSPVTYLAREDAALVVACFCIYALVAVVFGKSTWRMGLVWALAALVVVNLGLGVFQQMVDMKRWVFDGYLRTYESRIGGVFNNPNHFAALLAMSIPVFLSVAFFGKNHAMTTRLLLGFLCLISLLAIGASKSRGGLLAAAVGIVVFAVFAVPQIWQRLKTRKARVAVVAGFGVIAAGLGGVALLSVEMIGERFGTAAFSRASEMNRPLMWKTALAQNAESPLFGTGSRTYYFFSRKHRPAEMHVSVKEADFAHNEYFQAIADYGWIGLIVFGLLMGSHGVHGIRFLRKKKRYTEETGYPSDDPGNELALTMGALAGLAAILVHAFFDFVLHVPIIALVTAVFLGVLAVPGTVSEWRPVNRATSRFTMGMGLLTRAICPGVGTALAIFGFMYSQSEWHFEMARLRYESNSNTTELLDHLQRARDLDPKNPFIHTLSASTYTALIDPEMSLAAQDVYLEKAEKSYRSAAALYPQDIFSAIGFAEVLDALGKHDEAGQVLTQAREWAPMYGQVMQAQAEHWLRLGNADLAESFYTEARDASAFRDWRAALAGLEKIAEWRKLAIADSVKSESDRPTGTALQPKSLADLK